MCTKDRDSAWNDENVTN